MGPLHQLGGHDTATFARSSPACSQAAEQLKGGRRRPPGSRFVPLIYDHGGLDGFLTFFVSCSDDDRSL